MFLPLTLLLCPSLLLADIIYLKNGGKIVAPSQEKIRNRSSTNRRGEFALPRSVVERVEKSAAASVQPEGSRPSRELALELPAPVEAAVEEGSAVIHDGAVDEAYLRRLAGEAIHRPSPENLHQLKRAYQQAAVFLTRQGEPDAAILKYREAIKYLPTTRP